MVSGLLLLLSCAEVPEAQERFWSAEVSEVDLTSTSWSASISGSARTNNISCPTSTLRSPRC